MKKLIAMIGAVAMSFGLFADATPALFVISYEANEGAAGVSEDTWTPGSQWTWNGDPIPVITNELARVLPYDDSGSKARRDEVFLTGTGGTDNKNFANLSTGSDELALAVESGNLYLDQLVKFTGFEDPQTNLVAGTKIAVWMSEFEIDDELTTTNLYITCGKNVDGTYKQVALQIEGTYELNTWYRLTVESLGDIFDGAPGSTPRAGFLVWVNGAQATCEEAKGLLGLDASMITDTKKAAFYNAGRLFPSIAANAKFTSVGYQGIGAIDDIIVDAKGPGFCVETVETVDVVIPEVNGAVVDYVDVGGTRMQPPVSVPDGTEITVYFKPAPGKKITGGVTSVTQTISTGAATIIVSGIIAEDVVATLTPFGGTASDLAASELADALANLGVGAKIATVKSCAITDEEEATLYAFTPNTTITGTDNGATIYVGAYVDEESNTVSGALEVNDEVAAGETLAVSFEAGYEGNLTFGGTVAGALEVANGTMLLSCDITLAAGASIKAAAFDFDTNFTTITLSEVNATVKAPDNTFIDNEYIFAGADLVPQVSPEPDNDGYYTYTAVSSEPPVIEYVTFSVTYNTDEVENVTVKTNGADVVDVEGVYTVESNAVVTVAATAKTGYQNVTITGDNVTVGAGVFKASEAESVITIVAEEIPPATYGITFATVENGTLETSVTNSIAAGTTVTVTATPATGYECTEITTNGTAITGTSFEMPADDVEIGATFTLQQFTVAAISVDHATVVATNTVTDTGLVLPATVDYNTAIAVTVTPNENYEYKTTPAGWTKNGDGSITTNATVTANLAITVAAPTAALQPVDPETPKSYDSKEAADAAAAAINTNKMTMIKTPEGAVAADYTALFTAVVKANNEVVVELNEGGTNALKAAATTIETAVAGKLDDIAAATAGNSVSVTVTVGVKNGFWYGVAATADLTMLGSTQPTEWVQAKNDSVTIKATKPATGNAAFFQTRVKVK